METFMTIVYIVGIIFSLIYCIRSEKDDIDIFFKAGAIWCLFTLTHYTLTVLLK